MGGVGNGVTEEVPGWALNKKAGPLAEQCETMGNDAFNAVLPGTV